MATERKRQIIAMGGDGFTASPTNPPLERYILAQTTAKQPRVCFLGQATGDSPLYVAKFYAAFTALGAIPTHIPLFERTPDIRGILLSQDVIYVGGGNTKSMLAVWREWGVDTVLRTAWRKGIVLCGVSAGAICWFDTGITDSWEKVLAPLPCLGLLPGVACPHYDGEADRRPSVHRMLRQGKVGPVLALEDGVAAHFVGRKLLTCVTGRIGARGYRVAYARHEVVERPLITEPV